MRKAALLTLGLMPGMAAGYVLLVAYILNRVRPVPITFLPGMARTARLSRHGAAQPREPLAEDARYAECAA